MGFLKNINAIRRSLMRRITTKIGSSRIEKKSRLKDPDKIKKVLISRPNGRLGNLLLMTPIVQEVATTFPNCKIDLFVKGNMAPIIFQNYESVDRIIQLPKKPFKSLLRYLWVWISLKKKRYDLVINVVGYSSSGRLSVQFASSMHKFFGEVDAAKLSNYKEYRHIAKQPVYGLREYLAQMDYSQVKKPVPNLDLKLSKAELSKGKKMLEELVDSKKQTICLFTYATAHKCHSKLWWSKFYKKLKKAYPGYNIIEVLPVENVSQIDFKAPTFYSKNIREIGALIANTTVFIGADSGIMHLASAVKTPTIGLFSVPNLEVYEPYNSKSKAINTTKHTIRKCIQEVKNILVATMTLIEAA